MVTKRHQNGATFAAPAKIREVCAVPKLDKDSGLREQHQTILGVAVRRGDDGAMVRIERDVSAKQGESTGRSEIPHSRSGTWDSKSRNGTWDR